MRPINRCHRPRGRRTWRLLVLLAPTVFLSPGCADPGLLCDGEADPAVVGEVRTSDETPVGNVAVDFASPVFNDGEWTACLVEGTQSEAFVVSFSCIGRQAVDGDYAIRVTTERGGQTTQSVTVRGTRCGLATESVTITLE